MMWLLWRVPYWQRDEAQRFIDEIGKPPDTTRQTDARLLARFLDLLPSNSEPIYMMRSHDFAARWFRKDLEPLRIFATEWDNTEHEFIDPELEQKRKELLKAVDNFWGLYAVQTFVVRHDPTRSEVPRELETEDYAKFQNVVASLNKAAYQIFVLHQDLVRVARSKVGEISD
jgi:hypothetical protein